MKKIICPNCNEIFKIDKNKKYVECSFCGYEFRADKAETIQEDDELEKNNKNKKAREAFNKLFDV